MIRTASIAATIFASAFAMPTFAQQTEIEEPLPAGPPETIFDGDFLSVGIGVGYNASYSGSDDYNINILPIVQGSLGGIDINPRPAGVAVDLVPDPERGVSFSAGPMFRLRSDRADVEDINDDIVAAYGELDRAVEIGGTVGVQFPQLLNPFDSLSVNVDAAWDVAGAHGGMFWSPSVTYFTPLSRATAASLSLSATFIDDDLADYYFTVPDANPALPAEDLLPGFQAEGGLQSLGVNLLLAQDLSGDVTDGGLSIVAIGGWSVLQGDAAETPFTSIRGNNDQYFIALGLGYTF
ncbi:MipA/OmpV family protein [Qipengyuania vesicularis]|uniref:MipA/OmpV family protein n=1 Tax=Qipengyuania vesicularis TaxID=2867232 RepID=UPI001C881A44|nr:MipA/OmpV family protein [Qipengyuania vesicularis]MBX7527660.1 MipA/OmpV family protein [Qipengyuania vesicularis]